MNQGFLGFPPSIAGDVLTITTNTLDNSNSAFFNVAQPIGKFRVTFTWQAIGGADGIAFVLQNSVAGPSAVGTDDGGSGLGYYVISPSAAVAINIYTYDLPGSAAYTGPGTGYYTNGCTGHIALFDFLPSLGCGPPYTPTSPVCLECGHPIAVTLVYDGTALTQALVDTVTRDTFTKTDVVDIPSHVGGRTAFVGFTGATGGITANQTIRDFTFASLNAGWVDASPFSPSQPPARSGHRLVYDSSRNKIVLFGGQDLAGQYLNDVWEWDGATLQWTNVTPTGGLQPAGRSAFGMAYDPVRGRVIVHGGFVSLSVDSAGTSGETWEWDGSTRTWTLSAAAAPVFGGLWGPELAFDPNLGQVILAGGQTYFLSDNGNTYAYTGTSWSLVSTTGPPPRVRHAMTTDFARSRVVLFGGGVNVSGTPYTEVAANDTWEWDGAGWTPVAQSGTPPAPRTGQVLVYDAGRRLTVLFGGNKVADSNGFAPIGFFSDTWIWDGTTWALVNPPTAPSGRWSAGAYDDAHGELVVFGGNQERGPNTAFSYNGGLGAAGPSGALADTWLLAPAVETATALDASANPSTQGQQVTFTATVTRGGTPVTDSSVLLRENGVPITAARPLDANGQAQFVLSSLGAGAHAITAEYVGNEFLDASSGRLVQTVFAPPTLALSAGIAQLGAVTSGPLATQTITITNAGDGTLAWSAVVGPSTPWLTVSPGDGTAPAAITVTANPAGLAPGAYSGDVTITNLTAGGVIHVPVSLTVAAQPTSLTIDPPAPIVVVGETAQLGAQAAFSDGSSGVVSAGGNTWTTRAPMPTPRYGPGVAVANGVVYVAGGWRGEDAEGAFEAYDSRLDAWTSLAPLPAVQGGVSLAAVNGLIYAIGGSGPVASVHVYDRATNAWTPRAPMPTAREVPGVAVVNGIIYAIGGAGLVTVVEAYDPATDSWTTRAPMPSARSNPAVGVVNGIVYVAGGQEGVTPTDAYDPATNTWTSGLAALPAPVREAAGTGTIGGKLYVVGGAGSSGDLARVDVYDPVANAWQPAPPMPTARRFAGAGVVNGVLYVVGGQSGQSLDTVEAFFAAAGSWTTVDPTPPASNVAVGAAALGGRVYAVGGVPATTAFRAFDPSTSVWITLPPVPTGRAYPGVAVLDGQLYAVGGHDGAALGSVERYDPASNQWTPVAGMPTPRLGPGVGAVGGLIYVAGGATTPGTALNTLEVFDPAAGTWATKAPMPTARYGAATWVSGGKLYVAGGFNVTPLRVLEIYDPATDSWSAGSPMAVPRYSPGADVLNGLLYVVGGCHAFCGSDATATVEAYDPVSDTWIAAPSLAQPRAYLGAAAVNGVLYALGGEPTAPLDVLTPARPSTVVWRSADRGVATIDANGLVTGVEAGTTTITAVDVRGTATFDTAVQDFVVDCTTSGQLCDPAFSTTIGTAGLLQLDFTASPTGCSSIVLMIYIDGNFVRSVGPLAPGQSMGLLDLGVQSPGPHVIGLRAQGVPGGCNTGHLGNWAGQATIRTSGAVATATLNVLASPPADVAITMTAAAPTVLPGADIFYTVTVTNNGPATATGITWSVPLGGGRFDGVQIFPPATTCTPPPAGTSGTVTCTIAQLASGQSQSQNLFVIAPNAVGPFSLTATVSAATADLDQANNTSEATVTVRGGLITGTVRDAVTLAPIGGATVRTQDGLTYTSTTTKTLSLPGTYTLAVEPGLYHVEAIASGYATQYNGGFGVNFQAPLISVPDGGTVTVDFAMKGGPSGAAAQQAGGFCGQVRDASSGFGIPNADIWVSLGTGGFVVPFRTDANGNYSTAPDSGSCTALAKTLAPGAYNVQVNAAGYPSLHYPGLNFQPSAGQVIVAPNTVGPTNVDFVLTPNRAGGISGFVSDGVNGLAGVAITITAAGNDQFSSFTTTDANGSYTTSARLEPGNYKVRASAGAFVGQYYDGKTTAATANVVAVAVNTITSGVNFVLQAGGGVKGTITNVNGGGIAGARVDVFDAGNQFVTGTFTDALGNYDTGRTVPAGSYKVRVQAAGFVTKFSNGARTFGAAAANVAVVVGQDTPFSTSLAAGGGIAGTVTRASDGTPVAGAIVDVFDPAGNFVDAYVAADGTYTTAGSLAAGSYEVSARGTGLARVFHSNKTSVGAADAVAVVVGADTPVNFSLPAGASVKGTARDSGTNGVAGLFVDVLEAAPPFNVVASATTSATGDYENAFLLPGDYKVRVRTPAGSPYIQRFYVDPAAALSGLDGFTASTVTVAAGETRTGVDVTVQTGATITGVIREQATLTPLPGASVFIGRFQSNAYAGNFFTTTAANGTFTLAGLRDGEYTLRVEAPGHGVGWFSGVPGAPATDSATSTPILVSGGAVFVAASTGPVPLVSADVNLAPGGGKITGKILRTNGAQPPTAVPGGIQVQALIGAGGIFPRTGFVTSVNTDSSGSFTLSGLPSGQYVVVYIGNQAVGGTAGGWYPALEFPGGGSTSAGTALPVTVVDGQITPNVNFTVLGSVSPAAPRTISGVVKDTTGQPLPFAVVAALDPLTNFGVSSANTNGDGSYTITRLPPGRYMVRVQTEGSIPATAYQQRIWRDERLVNPGELVDVTAGNQSGIDIAPPTTPGVPPAPATVSGRVLTLSDPNNPSSPLVGVPGVFAHVLHFFDGSINSAQTRQDGSFLVRALPPGDFKVRASGSTRLDDPTKGFAVRYYTAAPGGSATFEGGSFIHLDPGQHLTGIDIVVAPATGRITGTVTDATTGLPVVGASVQVRDAATNAAVIGGFTRADGAFTIDNLAPGSYKVRVSRRGYATQWVTTKLTQDQADVIPVPPGAALNVALVPNQGGFSGLVFDSSGAPLRDTGIVAFDAATFGQGASSGFVIGTAATDSQGRFTFDGTLPPGEYVAQARALGYARTFLGEKADVAGAKSFAFAVTSPPSGPSRDFTMYRTADITGTISYAGTTAGTLTIGLFCDSQLTAQVYTTTIASPVFPQAYSFASPTPDTRGLLPSAVACGPGGQYFVSAFIDTGGGRTAAAPQGRSAAGITLAEAGVASADVTLTETAGAGGTTTHAFGIVRTTIPLGGGDAPLASVQITENGAGALSAVGRIRVGLPTALRFATTPTAATGASFGLTIVMSGADAPRLDDPRTFSFALGSRSTTGPASIIVSGMVVAVGAGLVPPGGASLPVSVTVDATSPNGLTAATVQTALLLAPPATAKPAFTGFALSSTLAGLGATRTVVLEGVNLNLLDFTGCPPSCPISFGTGITVVETPTVSADGTKLTVKITVDATAPTGPRTVTLTWRNPATGQLETITASAPGGGTFTVDPLPVVSGAGIALDANGTAFGAVPSDLTKRTIFLTGSNFSAPPTPQDFVVLVLVPGGSASTTFPSGFVDPGDVVVDPTSVVFRSPNVMAVDVTVAKGAELTNPTRYVVVINPDGGVSAPAQVLSLTAPQTDQIQGLPASKTSGTSTPPPTPTVSSLVPASAPAGINQNTGQQQTITVNGSNFGTSATAVTVTYPAPNGAKVTAKPSTVAASSFAVAVPATAITGNITVTVGTAVSAPFPFTVTNPRPAGVTPSSALQGDSQTGTATQVTLDVSGTNFQSNVTVALRNAGTTNAATGVTVGAVTFIDSTLIRVPVTIAPGATVGLKDLFVRNGDGGATTFPNAFEVLLRSSVTASLTLTGAGGAINPATWLPTVDAVSVTLDSTGKCTAKTVTPTQLNLRALLSGGTVPTLFFSIVPSALPGTASNENCEPSGTPTYDVTIGALGTLPAPVASTTTLTPLGVPVVNGAAEVQLWSWDWGGKVRITVQDCAAPCTPTVSTTLTLPLDSDGDDLPDVYEANQVPGVDNTNANGVNVLDPTRLDQNGNGVNDRNDRFAADGLTNFEKYRGIYLKGPLNGTTGPMAGPLRLGAGKRNLFVRGRGFSTDPAVAAVPGACGVDSLGNPTPNPVPEFPCPPFAVGDAFRVSGVKVIDVASSFTATSVLPTKSYANPATATLDLATVTYDAVGCAGRSPCDHNGKTGVRQWQFPTLGYSTFGTGTTYGDARVFVRAVRGYFRDRPYRHQENLQGTFLPRTASGKVMLAPITMVCDNLTAGADNGITDAGECVDPTTGTIGGDVFVPGVFNADATSMDVNNDGCIELPFVADPTTLPACDPTAQVADGVQATFRQVVRSLTTHELGHAAGINVHTTDAADLMYQYTINWTRDNYFSPGAAALLQIHNKGLQ